MLNTINVGKKELRALTEDLRNAYNDYKRSYESLENGLRGLTQKYFTGDSAPVFMQTFETKVVPNGKAMMDVVQKAINTMEEQTVKFDRTMSTMEDIARQ